MIKNFFGCFLLLLGFCNPLLKSQNNAAMPDTLDLEEVIVTGTPVKIHRNNIPMAISVVTRERIDESDASAVLPALNGRVPGLFVTERGVTGFGVAAGAAGQISLRGIGGSPTTGVLMLIDGHPQFMGLFGHPLADAYVASDVERVEVIRGPASLLYGSNAMGGAINIITRKQERDGFMGQAKLQYGSFNTQKYSASVGIKKQKFSVFASLNHDKTDGHRPNANFGINNGYLKLAGKINRNIQIGTDFSLAGFEAQDPGADSLNAVKGHSIDIVRGYWAFSAENQFEKTQGSLKVFYNFGEHSITDGFHSTDINYGVNLSQSLQLFKGTMLTVGGDFLNYGGLAENIKTMKGEGIIFTDTTVYDAGMYAFFQQSLPGGITLNAGIRNQQHKVYGSEWIPSGGFAWNISSMTSWKGNVSKGFRSPTLRELFMWGPNPNLSPERIMNYETGISQSFAARKIHLELTVFAVHGDNLILSVPMQGLKNAGEVNNKGVEFSGNFSLNEQVLIQTTYSYTWMKKAVYATPRHHGFLGARYAFGKFRIMSHLQWVEGLDTDASPYLTTQEQFVLFDSKLNYSATPWLDVFVSGENLLNTSYEMNRYYSMPGLTLFCGFSAKIQ